MVDQAGVDLLLGDVDVVVVENDLDLVGEVEAVVHVVVRARSGDLLREDPLEAGLLPGPRDFRRSYIRGLMDLIEQ